MNVPTALPVPPLHHAAPCLHRHHCISSTPSPSIVTHAPRPPHTPGCPSPSPPARTQRHCSHAASIWSTRCSSVTRCWISARTVCTVSSLSRPADSRSRRNCRRSSISCGRTVQYRGCVGSLGREKGASGLSVKALGAASGRACGFRAGGQHAALAPAHVPAQWPQTSPPAAASGSSWALQVREPGERCKGHERIQWRMRHSAGARNAQWQN